MAALDDELGLPEYEAGAIIGAPTAPAAVSALGEDEEAGTPADYGGGQDTYTGPTTSALLADPRVQARINSPRVPEFARQRLMELAAQQQQKAQAPDYQAIMNDPVAMQREMSGGRELQYPSEEKEKPKEEAGWGQIFSRGLLRANEAAKQGVDIAEGKKPRESKTPPAEFEQPLELGDFTSPVTAAKKLWFGLAQSYPAVAASVAGGFAGTAVGGPIAGAVGGAAGMGIGSALMELGPAYAAELQQTPDDVDGAWDRAMVTVAKAGVVGAASMALFSAGKPLSNALKSLLTPVVEGAAKPVAGIPLRAAVQTVGQPAISVGGQVAENVVEGKPLDTNLNQAVAGGLANVVPDVATALGGRVARRVLGGRRAEVTPGVTDEQKLALKQYGPELPPRPYPDRPEQGPELPPRPYPERQDYGPDLPPRPYPERQDYGPDLPPRPYPERQDYGPDLPPRPYPERGTPADFSVGQPPEEPPSSPPPPSGGPVPPPRPQPFAPEPRPVETAPTRPADFAVGRPPEELPPPPPVTTPEEFGISRPPGVEEPPPPPPGGGGPPPPPRPQPFPPTERPIGQRPTRPEDFTIERDHLDPSRSVAKDVNGEVVGKGATPEQATQDAALRQGAPYRDERVGFTTERGSTYEIHDDGTTTRNKSYHPEHGAEDVGPKPRSARTIYVDSQADAANLSGAGVSGAFGHRLVLNPDGTATLAWKVRPDAKWGTHANNRDIPFTTEPAVGKHPVEMWGKATDVPGAAEAYSGQHAGNKIVEMRGRAEAEQARPAEAGTNEQPISKEAPPAEAAKPEPAASGRDAASETPKEQTFRLPKTGHELTGTLGTGTVDPARPFVLSWRRNLLDDQGRPVRGASHTFTYADEASARTDLAAVREAGGQNAMLREFSKDLSTARDITEGAAPQTRQERLKAAIAELDARNAPDKDYQALLSTGSKTLHPFKSWRNKAISAANAGEKVAEVKAKGAAKATAAEQIIEAQKTEAEARVRRVTEKAKARAEERVTKLAEELRTETSPEDQGMRTKSGAYVSPGEAADVQASRPAVKTQSDLQAEVAADAATARKKGLVSEATRRMAEAPTPEEPFHVPDNLNTVRKAQRIIQHVLNGMPIADAVKAFGAKAEGTVGRPRNVESLSSFIREELKTADTGAAARDTEMAKAAAKLRKLGPEKIRGEVSPERRAILDELNERLKLSDEVRTNRAKLEDALAQVEAIERGDLPLTEARETPGRVAELKVRLEREAIAYRAARPEINEPILRRMESGVVTKLHDYLDDIMNSAAIRRLLPNHAQLAKALKQILPNSDVRDIRGTELETPNRLAAYSGLHDEIWVNPDLIRNAKEGHHAATAILHEALHVGTLRYVERLYRQPEITLSPQELAHKTALRAIGDEIRRVLIDSDSYLSIPEYKALGYTLREYAPAGSLHEVVTEVMTNPLVQSVLANTRASEQLKTTLANAGMGGRGVSSLWDSFKRAIRSIFKLEPAGESVLDHVLRPLSEITEVGANIQRLASTAKNRIEISNIVRHNAEVLGPVEARESSSLRRLGQTARDIADRGLIKTAMRGAFQSATTTAIRDFIKNDVPSAVSHFEYLRQITHASEQERVRPVTTHGPNGEERTEPNIDKARRLHQELKTGPDAPEVNKLMTEVTQAEMSVIDPRRNAHLVTDVQRRQQEAFQARFDALDPRAQQTYREVNEYHNEIYRAEREAKVKNLVDIAFGDRSEADKQALREQMRTKEGVLDVLNNPDATPVSRVLGRDWANKKDLVRLIAESQEGGFVDGDYFPSRRHGEYVVSAGEHNKPGYLVQMFETQSSAQVFRDQLIQSGRKDVSQVFVKSRSRPRDLVSVAALSTLDKAMERAGLSSDAAEVMRDMYAGIMIQHGTRLAERTMRREGIAGASVDQARNILGDFLAYTSRIGHLMHGADAARTLYAAEKEARALHQAGSGVSERRVANAQLGVEELRNRMSPGDGDRSADWMGTGTRALTTLTVLNTLLRPAHFFMQLAGTHAASTSLIAARHGYLSSVGAVNRAYAQLAGTAGGAFKTNAMAALRQELHAANWDLADMYRRRLSRANSGIAPDHADLLIDRLNQAGLINHTWIREIQRLAGPQGFGDGRFNFVSRFLDVSSAGEHAIDSMMRVGTAKAAFELEYAKNGGHLNDALDYAMQMAERSQPDYTMHNKARIATVQGSLGRLAPLTTQFRQFGLHMYGVQGNLLAEGVRGAKGSAERAEAFKSIAYLQASHALIWSGVGTSVFGSLPMMAGLGLFDLLNPNDPTNRAHTNREMETASRNWVRNITGSKTAADIFAHGVPMAFGLNVSRSLQFTNPLSPPELNSFNKPDVLSFLAQAITGASSDTAAGMVEGMSRIMGGDISKETIAKILPRVARDPLEAIIWGEQGLKTHKGDLTIVPPEKFSTADLIAKGLGFIPETSSTARDARAAINLRELTHRDITGSIIDRLVKAAPDERKAVLAEITRYNASVDPADRITGQQIQSRLREQARINAMPEQFGMRVPRREYGKIAEITAFSR